MTCCLVCNLLRVPGSVLFVHIRSCVSLKNENRGLKRNKEKKQETSLQQTVVDRAVRSVYRQIPNWGLWLRASERVRVPCTTDARGACGCPEYYGSVFACARGSRPVAALSSWCPTTPVCSEVYCSTSTHARNESPYAPFVQHHLNQQISPVNLCMH